MHRYKDPSLLIEHYTDGWSFMLLLYTLQVFTKNYIFILYTFLIENLYTTNVF